MFCLYKLLLTMSYYAEVINKLCVSVSVSDKPRREKNGLRGFRTVLPQIGLYRQRSRLRLEILAISRKGLVLSEKRKQSD